MTRGPAPVTWTGHAGLPPGHAEHREPADRAIREEKEETGISIDPAELTFAHVVHRRNPGEEITRVSFLIRRQQADR